MYTLWLGLGLSLLVSGLVRSFYKSLMITPTQLNPITLRILLVADRVNAKFLFLELSFRYLFYVYLTQMVVEDLGRVQLWLKSSKLKPFEISLRVIRIGETFMRGNWKRLEYSDILSFWTVDPRNLCLCFKSRVFPRVVFSLFLTHSFSFF